MYIETLKTIPFLLMGLPEGRAGVKKTLDIMAKLVVQSKQKPNIREFARNFVRDLSQKDIYGEVTRLFRFVRDDVRYIKDIRGIETLHTPEKILEQRAGDCDDKSVLIAALLESVGYECRFVAVAFKMNQFSHVFTQVKLRGKWITLETTEPWAMGKTAPGIVDTIIKLI